MKNRLCLLLSILLLARCLALPVGAAEAGTPAPTEPENTPAGSPYETPGPVPAAESAEPPTGEPTAEPTGELTGEPTEEPKDEPTEEPTDEPTAEPSPDAPPSEEPTPTAPAGDTAVELRIDDENVYEGMDRAYRDGYLPQVAEDTVTLILPLIASGPLRGNCLTVTPDLGDAASCPIQLKNYQRTFYLADNPVNAAGQETPETVASYLVRFDFPLRSDRKNGAYRIALDIRAAAEDGDPIVQSYNCYVNITDAKEEPATAPVSVSSGGGSWGRANVSSPRVLVSKYLVSQTPVMAGEDFTVTVTLRNTGEKQPVQNLLVTVAPVAGLALKNDTNTIFLGDLEAGGTAELTLRYGADRDAPAGRYDIGLAMEYDDKDAMSLTSAGTLTVEVAQPVTVELAPFTMPDEINAGETAQLSFQAMNLSRTGIYNVRVEVDVPGLFPSGSAFLGNMEPGTAATETVNVFAGMKEQGDRFGRTYGVVRLLYEDENGREYTQEVETSTNIKELTVTARDPKQEAQEAREQAARRAQWWIFVTAGGLGTGLLAGVLILRRRRAASRRHGAK